jgi:hypothetical protein
MTDPKNPSDSDSWSAFFSLANEFLSAAKSVFSGVSSPLSSPS